MELDEDGWPHICGYEGDDCPDHPDEAVRAIEQAMEIES